MRMRGAALLLAVFAVVLWAGCASHGRSGSLPPLAAVRRHLASGAQSDQYSTAVLNDGPTAYYRLDDTGSSAADSSGNGLNGAIGASVKTAAPGLLLAVADTAVSVPGTASSAGTVTVPATPLLQPASQLSLEAWIEFPAAPAAYTVAVAYGSDLSYAPYDLFFRAGGQLVAQFYLSSGVLEVADPAALSPNTPYHVVSTFDGSTGRLYVNGAQVASAAKSGMIADYQAGYGLTMGDDAAFSDPPFNGTIDEVAVYANKVLAAAQVLAHYQAGTTVQNPSSTPSPTASPSPTPTPSGTSNYAAVVLADAPGAYYHLDDSGTTAVDSSGHGLTGAVGSSVTKGVPGLLPSYADTAMTLPGVRSSSGVVSVPANASLQPAANLSLEAWIRFASVPPQYTVAVGYGNDSIYAPYDLFFRTGGKLVAQFYLNTGVLEVPDPVSLSANTTYYVVSTYDGTTGRLYVNGAQVASVAKSGTIANYQAGYGLTIGDDAAFSDPAFIGTVDEVAVYQGKTLGPSQVQTHYLAGNSGGTPPPTPTPPPGTDWTTMGYDIQRSGYNPAESKIGTGSFGTMHKLWTAPTGIVIGEPAYVANLNVGGVSTNVLYVGGANGTIYALNADFGTTIWSKHLGTSTYYCGTSGPYTFGINGAPVVDRTTNRIYVGDGAEQVHALNLASGAEQPGWPVTIGTTPNLNFIYGGLTYNPANHMLYAETSTTCDISPWYGRIAAINTSTASIVNTFYPTQGTSGGGIWGFGGASIDTGTNNVFIAVGNADTTHGAPQNAYYAEQIVELSPDLSTIIAHNYPGNPPGGDDDDFGATPLLFQPPGCPPLLAAVNKSGVLDLYNRNSIGSGPTQIIQMSITTGNGDFIGVPSYDPVTHYVYVGLPSTFGIYKPGAGAFAIQSNCTLNPTPAWAAHFGADGATTQNDTPRSPITIANGVAYVSDYATAQTYAFNAATGAQLWTQAIGGITGPVVVSGKLYLGGKSMTAWSP